MSMIKVCFFGLALMYLWAVVERVRCLSVVPELKGWYHVSIVACALQAGSSSWFVIYGDSLNRLLIAVLINMTLVPSALIAPAIIGRRTRRAVTRLADQARTNVGDS